MKLQEVIDRLDQKNRLFGSRVWGGSNDNSDYDYFTSTKETNAIINIVLENKLLIEYNNGSGDENILHNVENFKFAFNGKVINIIGYRDYDMDKVRVAFEKVDRIAKILPLHNRILRHRICEESLNAEFGNSA